MYFLVKLWSSWSLCFPSQIRGIFPWPLILVFPSLSPCLLYSLNFTLRNLFVRLTLVLYLQSHQMDDIWDRNLPVHWQATPKLHNGIKQPFFWTYNLELRCPRKAQLGISFFILLTSALIARRAANTLHKRLPRSYVLWLGYCIISLSCPLSLGPLHVARTSHSMVVSG